MYNYFMLVGRLAKDPEEVIFEDGKKVVNISLAVSRGFKNSNGEIETDFFTIQFWGFLIDPFLEYLKVGSPVGIKGRIQNIHKELSNGYPLPVPTLIGERILNFGSSSNKQKKEE